MDNFIKKSNFKNITMDEYLKLNDYSNTFISDISNIKNNIENPIIFKNNFQYIIDHFDKFLEFINNNIFINLLYSNINKDNELYVISKLNAQYLNLKINNPNFNNENFKNLLINLNKNTLIKIESNCKTRNIPYNIWDDLIITILGCDNYNMLLSIINIISMVMNPEDFVIDDYIFILKYKIQNDLNIVNLLLELYINSNDKLIFKIIIEFISQLSDINLQRVKELLNSMSIYNINYYNIINDIILNSNERVKKILA